MSPLIIKTLVAGIAKGCAAVIGFVVTIFITRTLGAEQSGLFLLGFTLVFALSGFFRLGLDHVILRIMGSEGISRLSQIYLNKGLLWISIAVVPFAIALASFSNSIAAIVFNKPEFGSVLKWFALALPSISLFTIIGMAFQGLHKTITSVLFQNLGLSLLFLICVVIWVSFGITPLTASSVAIIYAISALLIGLLGFILWFKQEDTHYQIGTFSDKAMWSASSNLWAASCMTLLVQWSGVLVAGMFIASQELAFLSAAQRTAMLTSFVLVVVNMVVAPKYAKLWQQKKIAEIQKLAKLSTRAMIAMVLPVILVFIIFPEWIMQFFGEGFERGSLLLLIMSLGQFVNVATGSVGYLLTMSGHEKDFRRVTLFAGPLTVILSYLLIIQYDSLGAAIATAIGLSLQNIGALFMVRKRLGFWPIG
tara:strand:+ start:9226 stop:10488 length:1263 start_codon:yes stop_codon:yes gene_type:complete